jgi:hypothetical protein
MGFFTDKLWKSSKVCSIILIGERWLRRSWGASLTVGMEFSSLTFSVNSGCSCFSPSFANLLSDSILNSGSSILGQKIKSDLGYLDDLGDKHDFNMYLSPPSENSTSSFWNSFEALKLLMPSTLTFSIASFSLLAQLAFRSFSSFSRSSILDNTSEYLLLTC